MNEVHLLGAYVHGALSALHGLGILYNAKRRNWFDVCAHSAWMAYDLHAMRHHWRAAR